MQFLQTVIKTRVIYIVQIVARVAGNQLNARNGIWWKSCSYLGHINIFYRPFTNMKLIDLKMPAWLVSKALWKSHDFFIGWVWSGCYKCIFIYYSLFSLVNWFWLLNGVDLIFSSSFLCAPQYSLWLPFHLKRSLKWKWLYKPIVGWLCRLCN